MNPSKFNQTIHSIKHTEFNQTNQPYFFFFLYELIRKKQVKSPVHNLPEISTISKKKIKNHKIQDRTYGLTRDKIFKILHLGFDQNDNWTWWWEFHVLILMEWTKIEEKGCSF